MGIESTWGDQAKEEVDFRSAYQYFDEWVTSSGENIKNGIKIIKILIFDLSIYSLFLFYAGYAI